MEGKKEYHRITYKDFLVNDVDKGKYSIRKLWNRIKEVSISKIEDFEKENNIEIQLLFNKVNPELSLFHYLPDNRETQEKCLTFVDKLNEFLSENLKLHPLT